MISDRRLWLTADKGALVEDGDPRAAFLWAGAGSPINLDEAQRLGYKPLEEATRPDPQPEPEEPVEPEPVEPVEEPEDGEEPDKGKGKGK